jgi:hypothetical protein
MALTPEDRQKLVSQREQQVKARTDASLSQLADEVRMCTRCGWKARKSECLARGIKACPQCGNTECVAQSMDFNMNPSLVRRQMQQGGG